MIRLLYIELRLGTLISCTKVLSRDRFVTIIYTWKPDCRQNIEIYNQTNTNR